LLSAIQLAGINRDAIIVIRGKNENDVAVFVILIKKRYSHDGLFIAQCFLGKKYEPNSGRTNVYHMVCHT
jgi:hypothetical protein